MVANTAIYPRRAISAQYKRRFNRLLIREFGKYLIGARASSATLLEVARCLQEFTDYGVAVHYRICLFCDNGMARQSGDIPRNWCSSCYKKIEFLGGYVTMRQILEPLIPSKTMRTISRIPFGKGWLSSLVKCIP